MFDSLMAAATISIIGLFLGVVLSGLLLGLFLEIMCWWTERTKNIKGIE